MCTICQILALVNNFSLCTFVILDIFKSLDIFFNFTSIKESVIKRIFNGYIKQTLNAINRTISYSALLRILTVSSATIDSLAKSQFLLPLSRVLEGNYVLVDTVCLRQTQHPTSQSEIQTPGELLSMYSCTNSSSNTYSTFFYIAIVISSRIYYINVRVRLFLFKRLLRNR